MKKPFHLLAALVATAMIATFFSATVVVELFGAVQLAAGALNLFLMGLNLRDGLRLSGWLAPAAQHVH